MPKCRKTTFDELYTVLCVLVERVTGRKCWRKMGIQAAPQSPYATVYLKQGPSPTQDVIEEVLAFDPGTGAQTIQQAPVGLTYLECQVEFFRNVAIMSALDAAVRFRQSLQMQSRFDDLWQITGLCGQIELIDVSAMFRADIEGRAEIRFNVYADIGALPLTNDHWMYEINDPGIKVHVNKLHPSIPPYATITVGPPLPKVGSTLTAQELIDLATELRANPDQVEVHDVSYNTMLGIYTVKDVLIRTIQAGIDLSHHDVLSAIFGDIASEGDIGIWPVIGEQPLTFVNGDEVLPLNTPEYPTQSFIGYNGISYRVIAEVDYTLQIGSKAYLASRRPSINR